MAREFQGHRVHRVRISSLHYGHAPDKGPVARGYECQPITYNRHGAITDGMKRVRDARARGQTHIDAIYAPNSQVAGCLGMIMLIPLVAVQVGWNHARVRLRTVRR